MKKMTNVVFRLLTYLFGIVLGIIFFVLRMIGLIRVLYSKRFPHWQGKILLVSNHPSVLEPFLLPALFFSEYLFCFSKYCPWSTPDENNFLKHGWWYWLIQKMIPVPRGDTKGEMKALRRMKEALKKGQIIILFPEGGRTSTGEKRGETLLSSPKGNKIRQLKPGVGWLALTIGALVLPVWVKNTDKVVPDWYFAPIRDWEKITIKIGKSLRFRRGKQRHTIEQVTQKIADALLELADEEE